MQDPDVQVVFWVSLRKSAASDSSAGLFLDKARRSAVVCVYVYIYIYTVYLPHSLPKYMCT